ncbi:hypothetical protein CUMW_113470 [Citrus unshiu]|nr:hypothetical protein CUMW_113470 [Citrus unshiu]
MENPKVQEILEKQLLTVAKAVEEKLDEEIAAIDRLDDDDLEALRERRLQQMKKMAEKRNRWISLGHGDYSEIQAEKDFFSVVKASDRVVCHFYRENWPCKVMDKHMSILAKKHIETRFVKIHAEKSPFLAERLKIVVLPTLALIKNAKVDDYVVSKHYSLSEIKEDSKGEQKKSIDYNLLYVVQCGKDGLKCLDITLESSNFRIEVELTHLATLY